MKRPAPRRDLIVLGVGNTLRRDDGVGPHLVGMLREELGPDLCALELYEIDIALAADLSAYPHLLVVDASARVGGPYRLQPLPPQPAMTTPQGFVSHVFDWGMLLGLAHDLYGAAPEAELLAVSGVDFELGEGLSEVCAENARQALQFLVDYCSIAS